MSEGMTTTLERPERQRAKRPPARPLQSPARSGSRAGRIWLGLGLLLVAALGTRVLLRETILVDPHLAQAKTLLDRYEQTRPEAERNYHNPVYVEALDHLDRVDQGSGSWDEAQLLATGLRRKIAEFEARLEQARQELAAQPAIREEREAEFFEAQH